MKDIMSEKKDAYKKSGMNDWNLFQKLYARGEI